MKHFIASLSFAVLVAGSAFAGSTAKEHETLFNALGLPEIIDIMREEGMAYGGSIGDDLFPNRSGGTWPAIVERIYDPTRMHDVLSANLRREMGDTDIAPLIAFFTSEVGSQLIALEVSGRRALLDETVEDASKEALEIATVDNTARYQLIKRFADVNDLIETNVVGSLNSNYAFYVGLVDGGGIQADVSDEDILRDVWSQEPEIRESTTEWLYSYLLMAYQPLPDSYIKDYITLSETKEGEKLNTALFAAFDVLFTDISKALGLGAASFMVGEDL